MQKSAFLSKRRFPETLLTQFYKITQPHYHYPVEDRMPKQTQARILKLALGEMENLELLWMKERLALRCYLIKLVETGSSRSGNVMCPLPCSDNCKRYARFLP